MKSLTQTELDEYIRKALPADCAVEELVNETKSTQMYQLSDGRFLKVWKATGKVQIGDTTNR